MFQDQHIGNIEDIKRDCSRSPWLGIISSLFWFSLGDFLNYLFSLLIFKWLMNRRHQAWLFQDFLLSEPRVNDRVIEEGYKGNTRRKERNDKRRFMWLIMNLKGCRNLKMPSDGYAFPPKNEFSWEKLQYIPLLYGSLPLKINLSPWVDWWLQDCTCLLRYKVTTNILCHCYLAYLLR